MSKNAIFTHQIEKCRRPGHWTGELSGTEVGRLQSSPPPDPSYKYLIPIAYRHSCESYYSIFYFIICVTKSIDGKVTFIVSYVYAN